MPQMMPINWMMSFFCFIMIFLTFNMMNFYNFNMKLNSNNKFIKLNKKMKFNWKW